MFLVLNCSSDQNRGDVTEQLPKLSCSIYMVLQITGKTLFKREYENIQKFIFKREYENIQKFIFCFDKRSVFVWKTDFLSKQTLYLYEIWKYYLDLEKETKKYILSLM